MTQPRCCIYLAIKICLKYYRELYAKFRCVASEFSSEGHGEVGLGVLPTGCTPSDLLFKGLEMVM